MSLDKDLEKLALVAIDGFNKKTGTSFTLEDIEYTIRRPEGWKTLCRFQLTTKAAGDGVRFQLDVNCFGKYTSITNFTLKVKPRSVSGDLSNEIFVADAILSMEDYKHLRTHLAAAEFKAFAASSPVFETEEHGPLLFQSGVSLFTQN